MPARFLYLARARLSDPGGSNLRPRFPHPHLGLLLGLTTFLARSAAGWGTPHTEITRHALKQLPASDRLEARLGGVRQMEDLCWGGDYQGEVHARYAVDDYLLFPAFPRHSSHLMPQVAETWRPYFLRTLQALRGESPQNAARWLGSFLHFVQDSGSPPHALPTGGVLHTRMENYVLALDLRITGYRPQEWGRDEIAVLDRLDRRMQGLVAFSRERALRLLPLAERNDRLACEPLVLECAQETMRVVADVTHALMGLSEARPRPGTATLRGRIRAPADAENPLAPARILVEGTGYSTLAEAVSSLPGETRYHGDWVLGDLPPGEYSLVATRTGCRPARKKLRLRAGQKLEWSPTLQPDALPGNLVRNADLSVRWLRPGLPDHWRREGESWVSDAIPVVRGALYEAGARDAHGPRPVALRTSDDARMPGNALRVELPSSGQLIFPHPYAQLIVSGGAEPTHAHLRPLSRSR